MMAMKPDAFGDSTIQVAKCVRDGKSLVLFPFSIQDMHFGCHKVENYSFYFFPEAFQGRFVIVLEGNHHYGKRKSDPGS